MSSPEAPATIVISRLGAGEHGRAIVAEGYQVGQPPSELDNTERTQRAGHALVVTAWRKLILVSRMS
jgi:hypothetical protein